MSLLTKTLIGALIPFLLVVVIVLSHTKPAPVSIASVDIGVEHTKPMSLTVVITRNDTLRLIEYTNDKTEEIALSVPDYWTRGEVRGVPLSQLKADAASFGYIRWHLPPGAGITFRSDQPFEHLSMHNPSGVLLKINGTIVDLIKNTGEHNVYLVKDGAVQIP